MARASLLFLVLANSWGCDAQFLMTTPSTDGFNLTQPSSMSASVGETVKISCTRNIGGISSYWNSWYQQKPGSAPMLLIYDHSSRASGISDRFSGSLDSSANAAILTISSVQAEDEADYYCSSYGTSDEHIFGGGTQLTVTGGPPSPPTVNLYCPSKEEMTSKGTGTLVCSITGFSPSAIETAWVAGGTPISNGVQTTKPIKDNDKYMASSYLPVTAREWERGNSYTCKVRHEEQDYMKSVSQSQCP